MRANLKTWLAAVAGGLLIAGNVAQAQTEDEAKTDAEDAAKHDAEKQAAKDEAGIKGLNKLDMMLYFAFDSDALSADATRQLDEVAMWAKDHPERQVIVAGHTDEIGTQAYNYELGGRRALSARKYLVGKGINEDRITVISFGESLPVSEENRENRRVVFLVGQPQPEGVAAAEPEPEPYVPPAPQPQPVTEPPPPAGPDYLVTPAGMAISIGGGVMDFTDSDTRDFTDLGGAWEARLTYGTRTVIGVEAAYIGSAQDIAALGLDDDAVLLGSSAEAALRFNIPLADYATPYALAGVGWTHFDLVNEDFNTSDVDDTENAVHIPLGVGINLGYEGFLFDIRGMYRPAFQDELVDIPEDASDDEGNGPTDLDSWAATAAVGVEF